MSDDDDDWGFYKFRGLLICGVIFAALFIYSLFDIIFLVFGREGTGVVTDAYVNTSRRGPDTVMVEFKFTDPAGKERTGKINIGDAAKPPPGTEFEIQYLPSWLLTSPDAARPKRPFGWITLSLFLLAAAGFGFFAWRAIYPPGEARTAPRSRRR